MWIDTHCHLDAPELAHDLPEVRAQARLAGVSHCIIPAVTPAHFDAAAALAHTYHDSYALGIHPLWIAHAPDDALLELERQLRQRQDDPRLVAVGEIGLDYFVPALKTEVMRARQWQFYVAQLKLAKAFDLPVLLHVRASVDHILKGLAQVRLKPSAGIGIAHAFNGSDQQAGRCLEAGLKLGFGGALTYQRATVLRHLAKTLPLSALVMETDAPDMPPHWLYTPAEARATGQAQGRNTPEQLPAIAQALAEIRGISCESLAQASTANACAALPKLSALLK